MPIQSVSFEHLRWFRNRLLKWFDKNQRSYAWRNENDPYRILMAEIMLRRTWASQVEPVYKNFIERFPNIEALANANTESIKGILATLGLPKRAQEIHSIGCELQTLFEGQVPKTREGLKQLTGVGDYVAGAVLSTAFNKQEWIVDTNIVRVFARFCGLHIKGEARKSPIMISLAKQYSQTKNIRNAQYAILDHGALICKPVKPLCLKCPVMQKCQFYKHNKINILNGTNSLV